MLSSHRLASEATPFGSRTSTAIAVPGARRAQVLGVAGRSSRASWWPSHVRQRLIAKQRERLNHLRHLRCRIVHLRRHLASCQRERTWTMIATGTPHVTIPYIVGLRAARTGVFSDSM